MYPEGACSVSSLLSRTTSMDGGMLHIFFSLASLYLVTCKKNVVSLPCTGLRKKSWTHRRREWVLPFFQCVSLDVPLLGTRFLFQWNETTSWSKSRSCISKSTYGQSRYVRWLHQCRQFTAHLQGQSFPKTFSLLVGPGFALSLKISDHCQSRSYPQWLRKCTQKKARIDTLKQSCELKFSFDVSRKPGEILDEKRRSRS